MTRKSKNNSPSMLLDAPHLTHELPGNILQVESVKREEQCDWTECPISDLCFEDRTIVEPSSELAIHLPYLSLEHVEGVTGKILKGPSVPLREEGRSVTFRFDSRHVLYGKLRPYLNKVALPDFAGRCTTEMIPLLPHEGVSREFLAHLLRRPQTVSAAMQEKTGARMPRANMKHVLSLTVKIPKSVEEQRRIAETYATRLTWISEAKRMCSEQIELLDAYAQKILASFPTNARLSNNENENAHE